MVPADLSSTSDQSILYAKDNVELPNYNTLITPSAPEMDDEPPNYFDVSIVPNGIILYNDGSNPYTEASKAEIERDKKGVRSFDSLIDKNPDQLWLYFMTYLNEKPRLKVTLHGYYTEVNSSIVFSFI
jgi:hypothetical protein